MKLPGIHDQREWRSVCFSRSHRETYTYPLDFSHIVRDARGIFRTSEGLFPIRNIDGTGSIADLPDQYVSTKREIIWLKNSELEGPDFEKGYETGKRLRLREEREKKCFWGHAFGRSRSVARRR